MVCLYSRVSFWCWSIYYTGKNYRHLQGIEADWLSWSPRWTWKGSWWWWSWGWGGKHWARWQSGTTGHFGVSGCILWAVTLVNFFFGLLWSVFSKLSTINTYRFIAKILYFTKQTQKDGWVLSFQWIARSLCCELSNWLTAYDVKQDDENDDWFSSFCTPSIASWWDSFRKTLN